MRLYTGSAKSFITDNARNEVADKLSLSYRQYFRSEPSPTEVRSWRNSLRSMSGLLQYAELMDTGVILEYQLPLSSKRLDCMLTGIGEHAQAGAVVVELKQWELCGESNGENEVVSWVGGANRDLLHPAVQVGQYAQYLTDYIDAFNGIDKRIDLSACAYLHNYGFVDQDPLLSPKFESSLARYPVFSKDDVDEIADYLHRRAGHGSGMDVLEEIDRSNVGPSKKLMLHVADVIEGEQRYVLLDEQLVAFDMILAEATRALAADSKTVVIVKGGPGTGKSVIAVNLMAKLARQGLNAHYSTGSRAFTETLRKVIGSRGAVQFKYFNSYMNADEDEIDVLIADEAHRVRKVSWNRFTKKQDRSNRAQLDELISVAKLPVFLLDDVQVVRPDEIGSVAIIKETAESLGCTVKEYQLEAQFRCAGSDGFVNWIDNTLGIRKTANVLWSGDEKFDFQLFDSPESLEEAILAKDGIEGVARMTAGFCWPWSKKVNADGTLVNDIVIGDYTRPWNARPNTSKLAKGIPPAELWAYDEGGKNQVGCVYTAQGFEFDYAGVIFGTDIVYDFDSQTWIGNKDDSYDTVVKRSKDQFVDLVKNTYRVLLSRGMKGCYVHFIDKDTERFVRSRMEV